VRSGSWRTRMIANVMIESRTITAMKSCRKPRIGECPMNGIAKSSTNRAPYASM